MSRDTSKTRREEITLTQLHTGHMKLTQEPPPKCSCEKPYTGNTYQNLTYTQRAFYNIKNMKNLLKMIDPYNIINFLKKINI